MPKKVETDGKTVGQLPVTSTSRGRGLSERVPREKKGKSNRE